jgi:hypothetical protein
LEGRRARVTTSPTTHKMSDPIRQNHLICSPKPIIAEQSPDDPGVVFFLGPGLLEVSGHTVGPAGQWVMIWIQVRDVQAEHAGWRRQSPSSGGPHWSPGA